MNAMGLIMKRGTALLLSALLLSGCASMGKPVEPSDPIPEALRLVGGEQYPGQAPLTDKVGRNNLSGTLAILDFCVNPEHECEYHPEAVKRVTVLAGVPDGYITLQEDTRVQIDGVSNVPEGTRVAVIPVFPAYREGDGLFLADNSTLIAVASASNMEDGYNGDRDIYSNPNHPAWTDRCVGGCGTDDYYKTMNALRNANGKALLATWAIVRPNGTVAPDLGVVMCGDAMHWCFAVRQPIGLIRRGTSLAAPILGAHAFYLSQLWDTAEEVFSVLKECAVDVGEPGPDREFGLGVPSAICETVQNRERQRASASLSVWGSSAAIPALLSQGGGSFSLAGQLSLSLSLSPKAPDLFLSFSSLALGKSFRRGSTSFAALAGAGYAPLGVSSSLTPGGRSYFAETGLKRTFLEKDGLSLSFLAALGGQAGTLTSLTTRGGVAFTRPSFTVYAGATWARASVPIPGHGAVGVPPAPASKLGWEVSLHRSFSLGSQRSR